MSKIQKTFLVCLLISTLGIGLGFGLERTQGLAILEGRLLDLRLTWKSKFQTQQTDIVLLLIDDASLEALKNVLGRWPWPRNIWQEVIEFLHASGAKDIAFDILFTEPSGPRDSAGQLPAGDLSFVQASAGGAPVVHSMQIIQDAPDEVNSTLLNRAIPESLADRLSLKHIDVKFGEALTGYNNYYLPFQELAEYSPRIGIVEFTPDLDGVYRRVPLVRAYQGKWYPSLPLVLFAKPESKFILDSGSIMIEGAEIPIDEKQNFLVGIHDKFPSYSISGVLAAIQSKDKKFFDGSEFKGKTVIIGASALGAGDIKNTALGARTPGVYLQASILDNLRKKDFLRPIGKSITMPLAWLLAFVSSLTVLLIPQVVIQIGLVLMNFVLLLVVGTGLLIGYGLVLPLAAPITALLFSAASSFLYETFTEGRERRKVRKMLSQYVSPVVLREVMDKRDGLKAEVGARENMSILFSDVRGFTTMSERLKPEQVVELLNFYLNEMVDSVFTFRGTLDKFVGDAVMAFWGAPIRGENHALLATQSALDMVKRLKKVNQELRNRKFPQLEIGIGIHTGDVILGNIGSEKKLEYTVIGDNVNLSSRVEGLTKTYHATVLISESTYEKVSAEIPCRILDKVCVKGKKLPIKIYAPMLEENSEKRLNAYTEAFAVYQEKKFTEAAKLYQAIRAEAYDRGEQEYCEMMQERCAEYSLLNLDDWDGSHVMTSK